MRTIINRYGKEIDFDVAVQFMDDDLREKIHRKVVARGRGVSDQDFFDIYCYWHKSRYLEEFFLNTENPQY